MPRYNVVGVSYPDILRRGGAVGTKFHQTDYGLLWTPPAMQIRFAPNAAYDNEREGATIHAWEVQNRSGGVASCGVGLRLANRAWKCGTYDGTTYTDATSSAQSGTGTMTFGVDAAATGIAIGCFEPFDWLSVNLTTAEVDAGNAVDHTVSYSNAAGTAFTTVDSASVLTDNLTVTNTPWTAAVKNFVWQKPVDWGKATALTGLQSGLYWLYITTAGNGVGDTAAIATGVEIGIGKFREAVADNNVYANDLEQLYSPYANGAVAYFSTANAGNLVSALVTQG